jgi:hypothetical protein
VKSSSKIILVITGYLLALVIAWVVVTIYVAATSGPDRQTYGAMYDFGDSILFLGVFALASLPATGAALFFLRPYQVFWRVLAAGAVGIAVTGIVVLADVLVSRNGTLVFPLCGWLAPTRFTRFAFLGATAVETIVFVWVALLWFNFVRPG